MSRHRAHDQFLESYDSTGSNQARKVANGSDRVLDIDEDKPANHGVEGHIERKLAYVSLQERHLRELPGEGALSRRVQDHRIGVNAYNRAGRANQRRRAKGHIPSSAPHIENTHPWPNAGPEEELCGGRTKVSVLLDQAQPLIGRPSHGIHCISVRLGHGTSRSPLLRSAR